MNTTGAALVAIALSQAACGAAYVVLEISTEVPLTIPTQANQLVVQVSDPTAEGIPSLEQATYALKEGDAFPLEVLVEPSDESPSTLREKITVLLDGSIVAQVEVDHPWKDGHVNRARVVLGPPP